MIESVLDINIFEFVYKYQTLIAATIVPLFAYIYLRWKARRHAIFSFVAHIIYLINASFDMKTQMAIDLKRLESFIEDTRDDSSTFNISEFGITFRELNLSENVNILDVSSAFLLNRLERASSYVVGANTNIYMLNQQLDSTFRRSEKVIDIHKDVIIATEPQDKIREVLEKNKNIQKALLVENLTELHRNLTKVREQVENMIPRLIESKVVAEDYLDAWMIFKIWWLEKTGFKFYKNVLSKQEYLLGNEERVLGFYKNKIESEIETLRQREKEIYQQKFDIMHENESAQ